MSALGRFLPVAILSSDRPLFRLERRCLSDEMPIITGQKLAAAGPGHKHERFVMFHLANWPTFELVFQIRPYLLRKTAGRSQSNLARDIRTHREGSSKTLGIVLWLLGLASTDYEIGPSHPLDRIPSPKRTENVAQASIGLAQTRLCKTHRLIHYLFFQPRM